MILVLGGLKGGSGKTTVAVNLAVLQSAAGREVLLVDGDIQQTARDFTLLRQERLNGDATLQRQCACGQHTVAQIQDFDSTSCSQENG